MIRACSRVSSSTSSTVTSGARLEIGTIAGERGSGESEGLAAG
jgi:hypothetical protein